MASIVELNIWILKWHFAFCFTIYNWLNERFRAGALVGKYTWGIVFVTHDWLVEHFIMPLEFEKSLSKTDLVTTRLERYKGFIKQYQSISAMPSLIKDRYLWAVTLCNFLNRYDKKEGGHC